MADGALSPSPARQAGRSSRAVILPALGSQPALAPLGRHLLPRPPRSLRRGRHDPGPSRDGRRPLRRGRASWPPPLGMDKAVMKELLRARGLPDRPLRDVVRDVGVAPERRRRCSAACAREFCLPDLRQARQPRLERRHHQGQAPSTDGRPPSRRAFRYDRKIVVEKGIGGRELECSVLGNDEPEASLPGEVIPFTGILRLRRQVHRRQDPFGIPADLPAAVTRPSSEALAVAAFQACDARAWPGSISSSRKGTDRALRQRDQHHPRLHRDQHVPQALGRVAACPSAGSSTGSSSSGSSGTGARSAARKGRLDEDPRRRLRRPPHRPGPQRPPAVHRPAARPPTSSAEREDGRRRYFRDLVGAPRRRPDRRRRLPCAWTAARGRGPRRRGPSRPGWRKPSGCRSCFWDERLTTHQAIGIMQEQKVRTRTKKFVEHQISASLILQSYLDLRRHEGHVPQDR